MINNKIKILNINDKIYIKKKLINNFNEKQCYDLFYNKLDIIDICKIFDTLVFARKLHPGQKNSLDALCKRYGVDNSSRDFHGALLDAKILADVYLLLTGGQTSFDLEKTEVTKDVLVNKNNKGDAPVIKANEVELREHREFCEKINETSSGRCIWNISKF